MTIYAIGNAESQWPIKIGWTERTAHERLFRLRKRDKTKIPALVDRRALFVLHEREGDHQLEQALHAYFAERHVLGEWFVLPADRAPAVIEAAVLSLGWPNLRPMPPRSSPGVVAGAVLRHRRRALPPRAGWYVGGGQRVYLHPQSDQSERKTPQ